jgi:putative hemolysin
MARGFESKDVEFQQAEASRKNEVRRAPTPLSEGEREALARRQTLELSLARVRSELASATSQAHRRMLERAIASLEAQVEAER